MNSSAGEIKDSKRLYEKDPDAALSCVFGAVVQVKQFDPMNHNEAILYESTKGQMKYMALAILLIDGEDFQEMTVYDNVALVMLGGMQAAEYDALLDEDRHLRYAASKIEAKRWKVRIGLKEYNGKLSFIVSDIDTVFVDDRFVEASSAGNE